MSIAYIGLGSNIGDKVENLNRAVKEIGKIPDIKVLAVSSFYRTEPVGDIEQEWFVNAAVKIETSLTPRGLLNNLLEVEKRLGRVREVKWGPRVIDLDILLYNNLVIKEEGMVIPHPFMHGRGFVLAPLAEIGKEAVHPGLKKSIKELFEGVHDNKKIEKIGGTSE